MENMYYFVHKTTASESLSQSTGPEGREIRRHVQKRLDLPQTSRTTLRNRFLLADDRALYNRTVRRLSCTFDPFNSASIPINGAIYSLLQIPVKAFGRPVIWIHEAQRMSALSATTVDSNYAAVKLVQHAIKDSLMMYCLLSAGSSSARNIGHPLATSVSRIKDLYFTSQAIRLLQDRIANIAVQRNATLEPLAFCIIFLVLADINRDNYASARMHSEALVRLIRDTGGIVQIQNKCLREHLLMTDIFLSIANMEPCLHGCAYDPGPAYNIGLIEQECIPGQVPLLGTELLRLDGEILSTSLRKLVLEVIEYYNVHCRINTAQITPFRRLEVMHWAAKRNMAIMNRLLALTSSDTRVNALRITILLWMIPSTNSIVRTKTPRSITSKLKLSLEQTHSSDWIYLQDVQFWILCVGFSLADKDSSTANWFKDQIRLWAASHRAIIRAFGHGLDLCNALENFQQGFLFNVQAQRIHTQNIAELLSEPCRADSMPLNTPDRRPRTCYLEHLVDPSMLDGGGYPMYGRSSPGSALSTTDSADSTPLPLEIDYP